MVRTPYLGLGGAGSPPSRGLILGVGGPSSPAGLGLAKGVGGSGSPLGWVWSTEMERIEIPTSSRIGSRIARAA